MIFVKSEALLKEGNGWIEPVKKAIYWIEEQGVDHRKIPLYWCMGRLAKITGSPAYVELPGLGTMFTPDPLDPHFNDHYYVRSTQPLSPGSRSQLQ